MPLPGDAARLSMMPPYRLSAEVLGEEPENPRRAAVLLLAHPGAGGRPAIALIERAPGLGRHAGQVSLPGGALEPGEAPVDCALREASEEIGAELGLVELLGPLSAIYVPPSGFHVEPFVAISGQVVFQADGREAISCFDAAIEELMDPGSRVLVERAYGGRAWQVPAFRLAGREVWGATAMILAEFAALLDNQR
jgi:8-oxo-dGTP pyrophosphatase MutT (NUDIX family)